MRYETVLVDIKDKVAKVILNRPEKKNAMNPQLIMDMTQVLEDLRYDDDVAGVDPDRRRRRLLCRHGPQGILLRPQRQEAEGVRPAVPNAAGMARPHTTLLSEADDRDGEWLLLRRRIPQCRML